MLMNLSKNMAIKLNIISALTDVDEPKKNGERKKIKNKKNVSNKLDSFGPLFEI